MTTLPDAKLYIDGKLCDAASGATFDVVSPWTGEVVGKAADGGAADVEAAIAAARKAFDTTDWSTNHDKRLALVKKLRELFEANRDKLADLAVHEVGAARGAVNMAHVNMALDGWDEYLKVYPQLKREKDYGTKFGYGFESKRIAVYEAIGVVAIGGGGERGEIHRAE